MNNHEITASNQILNADDFVGGYLSKDDLPQPRTVTIKDVRAETIQGANRQKLVLEFSELAKPMILNSTNIGLLKRILQTSDCSQWLGKVITVYTKNDIEFGGKLVGGIRVAPAKVNGTQPLQKPEPQPEHKYYEEPDFF